MDTDRGVDSSARAQSVAQTFTHAAHDLRNVLAIIRGCAELIITTEPPIETNGRIQTIHQQTGRAFSIMDRVGLGQRLVKWLPAMGTIEIVDLAEAIRAELDLRANPNHG